MTTLTVGSGGYSTIQAAVDAAVSGDTILVSSGIYVEQVIVTAKNNLTIAAAAGATVTVQAPNDVHPTALSSTNRSINAIVTVISSANFVLDNIDIDGNGRGNTADLGSGSGTPTFDGLYLRNSSATLLGVDITGMRDAYRTGLTTGGNPILDGLQHGLGIRVDNDSNLDFTMTGGSITDFQKNATSLNHVNLAMTGVTVTGGGAQPVVAQNGIQVSNSTGYISGNTITGIGYSGPADAYSGALLLFGNTGLDIVDNVIVGSNGEDTLAKVVGIYIFQSGAPNSGGEIAGNTISGVDFGLYADGVISPEGFYIHDNNITSIDLTNPTAAGIDFQPTPSVITPFGLGSGALFAVEGSALHDDIAGGAGADFFLGLAGNDRLSGNGGNDILDGGPGDDLMIGGTGDDLFYIDSGGDVVTELAGGGTDEIRTGLPVFSMQPFGGVEILTGTASTAQDLRANAENNLVTSGPGGDFIRLQDGGTDKAITGAGDDAVYFGNAFDGTDTVDAGAGRDVVALQGDYSAGVTLAAGALVGVETLSLLSSTDTRFGGEADTPFDYDLTTVDANVTAGAQLIVNASTLETSEDLAFEGSVETDGSFFIYGGKGTETLTGGAGADVFFFAEGRFNLGDRIDGGAGKDIIVLRGDYSGANAVTFAADALTNIETVTLMSASDTRFYEGGTRYAYDVTTNDGNVAPGVTMTFNAGSLTAEETLSFDGSAELDGNFRVFGGAGADSISGGAGDDLIFGGLGTDQLAGGAGNDVFRYQSTADSTGAGPDTILDFSAGDRVELSRIDADTVTAGHQSFTFIGSEGFGMHAGELRAEATDGAHWFVQADTDGDGVADFQLLLTVSDLHPITAGDFLL